jgi:tetratricopeptide (TPR) repeat protein
MAVFYPHPGISPWWKILGAFLVLAGISLIVIKNIGRRPYLTVGWLWFLGTLVPVIGLVQAGTQAMADRFAYVPFIGLYIVVSWGVLELVAQWRYRKICLATLATVVLTILIVMTWKQVGYWENSITLFEHTLKITSNNYIPHNNLGNALEKKGRTAEAIDHYIQALCIKPDYAEAHHNLGLALDKQGRTAEAIEHYLQALRIKPNYVDAHNNLAIALFHKGNIEESIAHFRKALRINPDHIHAKNNLEKALMMQQQGQ